MAVPAFAGLAGKRYKGHPGRFGSLLDGGAGKQRHLGASGASQHPGSEGLFGRILLNVPPIKAGERSFHLHPFGGEALVQVHHVGPMHVPGSSTPGQELIAAYAEERHSGASGHRQRPAGVFHQHDAFFGGLAGHGGIGLQMGLEGRLVSLEGGGFHHKFQHPAYAEVQMGLRKFSAPDLFHQLFCLGLVAGLHQVASGGNLGGGVALAGPVRHHQAFEAPFLPEHVREQPRVFLGVNPVQAVIGSHHGPGLRFPDGNLEVPEVDFPEGLVGHLRVVPEAVGFLVVGGKVLH